MKKQMFLLALTVMALVNVNAADLLVEEFGLAPAYSSIGAAVTAATDGDRIIIRNRAGNIPWVEDITINKSLSLLPYDNDTFFVVQGTYTITPANNRKVNIIGMKNTSGNITAGSAGSASARTIVNVLGSYLINGFVNIANIGYDATVAHTKLDEGSITLRHGGVYGCDVSGSNGALIIVPSETTPTNETIKIYGNKLNNLSTSSSAYGISWNSTTHFHDIRNNYILTRSTGIYVTNTRAANTDISRIYNNTLSIVGASTASTCYGIYIVTSNINSIVEVMNNLVDVGTSYSATFYGIYNSSSTPQVNAYFNAVESTIPSNRRVAGTYTVNSNNTIGTVSLNADGSIIAGSAGINTGNPANVFYDLDLTANDCGAYGGSFSLQNFFPIHAGAARVYMVTYPFNLRQGSTLNIQGQTYDR